MKRKTQPTDFKPPQPRTARLQHCDIEENINAGETEKRNPLDIIQCIETSGTNIPSHKPEEHRSECDLMQDTESATELYIYANELYERHQEAGNILYTKSPIRALETGSDSDMIQHDMEQANRSIMEAKEPINSSLECLLEVQENSLHVLEKNVAPEEPSEIKPDCDGATVEAEPVDPPIRKRLKRRMGMCGLGLGERKRSFVYGAQNCRLVAFENPSEQPANREDTFLQSEACDDSRERLRSHIVKNSDVLMGCEVTAKLTGENEKEKSEKIGAALLDDEGTTELHLNENSELRTTEAGTELTSEEHHGPLTAVEKNSLSTEANKDVNNTIQKNDDTTMMKDQVTAALLRTSQQDASGDGTVLRPNEGALESAWNTFVSALMNDEVTLGDPSLKGSLKDYIDAGLMSIEGAMETSSNTFVFALTDDKASLEVPSSKESLKDDLDAGLTSVEGVMESPRNVREDKVNKPKHENNGTLILDEEQPTRRMCLENKGAFRKNFSKNHTQEPHPGYTDLFISTTSVVDAQESTEFDCKKSSESSNLYHNKNAASVPKVNAEPTEEPCREVQMVEMTDSGLVGAQETAVIKSNTLTLDKENNNSMQMEDRIIKDLVLNPDHSKLEATAKTTDPSSCTFKKDQDELFFMSNEFNKEDICDIQALIESHNLIEVFQKTSACSDIQTNEDYVRDHEEVPEASEAAQETEEETGFEEREMTKNNYFIPKCHSLLNLPVTNTHGSNDPEIEELMTTENILDLLPDCMEPEVMFSTRTAAEPTIQDASCINIRKNEEIGPSKDDDTKTSAPPIDLESYIHDTCDPPPDSPMTPTVAGQKVSDSTVTPAAGEFPHQSDTFSLSLVSVTDSQLNRIALSMEQKDMAVVQDQREDATELVCGLITELTSLNRIVMAAHREMELLRRGNRFSRSRGCRRHPTEL